MAATKVHQFLDEHGVSYDVETHERAVSAQRLAASEHVSGWDVAKPVMLSVSGQLAMVVVPAPVEVDLSKAHNLLGGNDVRLAREDEFAQVFDDCEEGAEPPFGNLYGVPVFLDGKLRERPRMVCRDGSHIETVTVATEDFVRLVRPEIVDITGEAH